MWSPSRKQAVTSAAWYPVRPPVDSLVAKALIRTASGKLPGKDTQTESQVNTAAGLGPQKLRLFLPQWLTRMKRTTNWPGWREQPMLLCYGDYCGLRLLWLLTVIVTLLLTRSSKIPTSGYWSHSGVLSVYVNSTFPPGPLHPQAHCTLRTG